MSFEGSPLDTVMTDQYWGEPENVGPKNFEFPPYRHRNLAYPDAYQDLASYLDGNPVVKIPDGTLLQFNNRPELPWYLADGTILVTDAEKRRTGLSDPGVLELQKNTDLISAPPHKVMETCLEAEDRDPATAISLRGIVLAAIEHEDSIDIYERVVQAVVVQVVKGMRMPTVLELHPTNKGPQIKNGNSAAFIFSPLTIGTTEGPFVATDGSRTVRRMRGVQVIRQGTEKQRSSSTRRSSVFFPLGRTLVRPV